MPTYPTSNLVCTPAFKPTCQCFVHIFHLPINFHAHDNLFLLHTPRPRLLIVPLSSILIELVVIDRTLILTFRERSRKEGWAQTATTARLPSNPGYGRYLYAYRRHLYCKIKRRRNEIWKLAVSLYNHYGIMVVPMVHEEEHRSILVTVTNYGQSGIIIDQWEKYHPLSLVVMRYVQLPVGHSYRPVRSILPPPLPLLLAATRLPLLPIINEAGESANYILNDEGKMIMTGSIPPHSIQTLICRTWD